LVKDVVNRDCGALFEDVFIGDLAQKTFGTLVGVLADADILAIGLATDVHFGGIIRGTDLLGQLVQMGGFGPPKIARKMEGRKKAERHPHRIITTIQPMDTYFMFFQNKIIQVPSDLMKIFFLQTMTDPLGMEIIKIIGFILVDIMAEILQGKFFKQVFFCDNKFDLGFEWLEKFHDFNVKFTNKNQ
jgi:hypothetical protein